LLPPVRTPVRRAGAAHYMALTVLSFGTTVVLTRLYLAGTGSPQIGNGEFHIAHLLWGGLLLFLAALLPLLLSNRAAFTAAALLGGSGVGLFMDEVGKFITRTHNYFHPLAAPLIYGVFLLTVFVYLEVRRPPPPRLRDELYRVFENLGEVLDRDLDRQEQAALHAQLQFLATRTERPDLVPLVTALLNVVTNEPLRPPPPPSWSQRLGAQVRRWEGRWLSRRRLKGLLLLGLLAVTGLALSQNQILHWAITTSPQQGFSLALLSAAEINVTGGSTWFLIRLGLVVGTGLLLLGASGLFILGHDRYGVIAGQVGLFLALTGVSLFIFYFDQFATVGTVFLQYLLLLTLLYYRRRFMQV
jgi:hypothetical protein